LNPLHGGHDPNATEHGPSFVICHRAPVRGRSASTTRALSALAADCPARPTPPRYPSTPQRAEHNEGNVTTLEEVALHQQNIERIEALGHLCRHLKILYLQNNLIGRLENLHRLKELEYLNVAVNNIVRIENLQRCESLKKLDLTMCFVPVAGLLSLKSLAENYALRELYLVGNPCADWVAGKADGAPPMDDPRAQPGMGYRDYVVGTLPQLTRLDGKDVKPSDRITAQQALPALEAALWAEVKASGEDPEAWARPECQGPGDGEEAEGWTPAETGRLDEKTGEMLRPWCRETRILEHRENEAREREAEEARARDAAALVASDPRAPPPRRDAFPDLVEGEAVRMRNEGDYEFTLEESEDGKALVLEVDTGRFLDTSLIQADVQPNFVRLLIKGRLLQLALHEEISPDASTAERSKVSGRLVVTMPRVVDRGGGSRDDGSGESATVILRGRNPMVAPPGYAAAKRNLARRGVKDAAAVHRVLEGRIGQAVDGPGIRRLTAAAVTAAVPGSGSDEDEPPPLVG